MTQPDARTLHPHVPFLYEMMVGFFELARDNLEPVLEALDGFKELETDAHGKPNPPDHITQKFAELPKGETFNYVGACLSGTTNLGLAYVHAFRLLGFLTQGRDPLPAHAATPHLVKLFDALPEPTRRTLCDINKEAKSHDLEIEIATGPPPEGSDDAPEPNVRDFRSTLAYWQSWRLLQDSHRSLFGTDGRSALRLFLSFHAILVLDMIIAREIAPQLGVTHETVDQRMTEYGNGPKLKWEEGSIHVALPKRLGRGLSARWKPSVTSVIRIREKGAKTWSPGFEIPFNMCTFVDLKPETSYDIRVTHKNDAGEGPPSETSLTTGPKKS